MLPKNNHLMLSLPQEAEIDPNGKDKKKAVECHAAPSQKGYQEQHEKQQYSKPEKYGAGFACRLGSSQIALKRPFDPGTVIPIGRHRLNIFER
jgi:hypothetical protein